MITIVRKKLLQISNDMDILKGKNMSMEKILENKLTSLWCNIFLHCLFCQEQIRCSRTLLSLVASSPSCKCLFPINHNRKLLKFKGRDNGKSRLIDKAEEVIPIEFSEKTTLKSI